MIYEVVNPSDPMTIEAEDSVLASLAITLLSNGAYGLYDEDGRAVLPIFRFSKPELFIRWLNENNIDSNKIEDFYVKNGREMAAILESMVYGDAADRKGIMALAEKMSATDRADAIASWNNSKRSSLTNIAAAAINLAKTFRKKADEGLSA